jgi:hypothetical protein
MSLQVLQALKAAVAREGNFFETVNMGTNFHVIVFLCSAAIAFKGAPLLMLIKTIRRLCMFLWLQNSPLLLKYTQKWGIFANYI